MNDWRLHCKISIQNCNQSEHWRQHFRVTLIQPEHITQNTISTKGIINIKREKGKRKSKKKIKRRKEIERNQLFHWSAMNCMFDPARATAGNRPLTRRERPERKKEGEGVKPGVGWGCRMGLEFPTTGHGTRRVIRANQLERQQQ